MNTITTRRLLKAPEAAAWLGIGVRKLWELRAGGLLPVVHIGRSVRFDERDLEIFIEANKRQGPGA